MQERSSPNDQSHPLLDRWAKLEVWQMADDLARQVYRVSAIFPKEEMYGVTSQLRRAALSIPTNIVEGYGRKGDCELARFVNIGLGSLAETKYLLHFSHSVGYLSGEDYSRLQQAYHLLGQRL